MAVIEYTCTDPTEIRKRFERKNNKDSLASFAYRCWAEIYRQDASAEEIVDKIEKELRFLI